MTRDELYRKQVAGMQAQERLNQNLRLQERQAEQLASMPMPEVKGEGYSAVAPNIFENLAVVAQRHKGNQQIKGMQQQAEALRGEVGAGRMAELQAQQQRQEAAWEQNRMMAQEAREARGDSNRMHGRIETWVDENGNKVNVAMSANGPVDSTGKPVNLEGFTRYREQPKRAPDDSVRGLPQFVQRNAMRASKELGTLGDISARAQQFAPDDYAMLNKATMNKAISAATPRDFENYVEQNLKTASPAVRGFLEAVYAYSAERRKDLSGSALTAMEKALSEMFLPSASGNNFADIMRRIDREADASMRTTDEIDAMYGTNLKPRMPVYTPWAETEAAKNYVPPPPKTPLEQLGIDKYLPERLNESSMLNGVLEKIKQLEQELTNGQ